MISVPPTALKLVAWAWNWYREPTTTLYGLQPWKPPLWLWVVSVLIGVGAAQFLAWRDEYLKRVTQQVCLEDLKKRIADDGPTIWLGYEKSAFHTGVLLKSSKDIAGLSIQDVQGPSFSLVTKLPTKAPAGIPVAVEFTSVRGHETELGLEAFAREYCGDKGAVSIPLELSYADLRGNKFRVRWFIDWDLVQIGLGLSLGLRFDPDSYQWVKPHTPITS